MRGAAQRPVESEVRAGLDELLRIQSQASLEPRCVGVSSGHQEQVPDLMDFARLGSCISPVNTFQARLAIESLDFSPCLELDLRAGFNPGNQIARHRFG